MSILRVKEDNKDKECTMMSDRKICLRNTSISSLFECTVMVTILFRLEVSQTSYKKRSATLSISSGCYSKVL